MDWKDVARKVAPLAPKLGELIGDLAPIPFGGTMGRWAGEMLANQLGVEATPEAVGRAIDTKPAPVVAAAAQATEAEAVARLNTLARIAEAHATQGTETTKAINETQRVEIAQGVSWWHWRHLIGYLVLLYGLQQLLILTVAAFRPTIISPADAAVLFNATMIFTGGLFALLGYVASDTTALKVAAVTGEAPGKTLVQTVVEAVKPKPKR